jgi:Mg2+ and Co2+ transporter CorA
MASLIFSSFLKAIYKEMVLSKVKELSDTKYITDEEKYKKLASTLQQHSMSLKAIKDIDDCIFYQFGIQNNLNNLLERYNQEANNVQNNKISILTHITAVISLFSLVVATLAIGVKGSLFSLGMYWTVYLLVIAVVTPVSLLSYFFIKKRIWNKYKRNHYVKNNM